MALTSIGNLLHYVGYYVDVPGEKAREVNDRDVELLGVAGLLLLWPDELGRYLGSVAGKSSVKNSGEG